MTVLPDQVKLTKGSSFEEDLAHHSPVSHGAAHCALLITIAYPGMADGLSWADVLDFCAFHSLYLTAALWRTPCSPS